MADDFDRAEVFENLGIDYCCHGNDTLEEACAKKGLNPDDVMARLDNKKSEGGAPDFASWPLDLLVDYVLKTRFGDGYRSSYSSTSIWTDGVIGTEDDILSEPSDDPFANFCAACAEALGAEGLRESDPAYAAYSLKIAREDFRQRHVTAMGARGFIAGFGVEGYALAIQSLLK